MRLIASLTRMQAIAGRWKKSRLRIGLVPTMGCLHAGHVSLIKTARRAVARRGRVIVSVYVNPTQFGPGEDFQKYPRNLKADAKLCRQAGADLLFAPSNVEVYPRAYSTYLEERSLSRRMEGRSRPGHFAGVTTIVAKLFHITRADVAVFGAKDFQQAAIIKQMVRDLNFDLEMIVAPTVRESNGLALSSRNQYLSPQERAEAAVLWQAIQVCRQMVARRRRPLDVRQLRREVVRLIATQPRARLDYVEFFHPENLEPVARAGPQTQMALAVFIGATRLIDNALLG